MALKRNPAARGREPGSERVRLGTEHSDHNLPDSAAQHRRDFYDEAHQQASIVEFIRTVAPSILIFHVPNGGLRAKREAARMRWQGVVAGVPDLCLIAPGGRAFFIECKTADGRLSQDQRSIHEWLTALGTSPAICRSIDDARWALAAWGISTREMLS